MRVLSEKLFFARRLSLLGEARDCLGLAVVHVEDGQQLGNLQDFLEFAAQVGELQRRTLRLGAVMRGHKRAETRAVDERDVRHVQHNFFLSFGDQAIHLFAKRVALFSEHDASIQRHHGHAIHFPVRHLQSHCVFLLIG